MAFVPDEAITDSHEISPAAFRLFAFVCAARNRKSGGFNLPPDHVRRRWNMPEPTYYRARNELLKAGWIRAENKHFLSPLKGFEIINSDNFEPPEFINSDKEILSNDNEIINSDKKIIKTNSAHIRKYQTHIPATLPEGDYQSISEIDSLVNRLAKAFPKDDRRLIEIGTLNTLIRRREGPTAEAIQTVKYFHPEIMRMIEGAEEAPLKDETIDVVLKARRESYFGAS